MTNVKMHETRKYMGIPQFRSFVDKQDYASIERVFDDKYIAEGKVGIEFRDELLKQIGSNHAVLASNGTLALYLGLKALGIGPGDEVIVQNTTFIATANAVEMVGATPVFVDVVSFSNLSLDISKIQLTPKTRAIMVAHLYGTACSNIEDVVTYCETHGLYLIEDAAQALAIENGKKHCGTFGHVGTFSFFADKTITTGEGGLVVTDDESIYEKMMYLRNQGRLKSGTFVHPEIGFNFRLTDIQSALGLSQLSKLDHIIAEKTSLYQKYYDLLSQKVKFLDIREDFSHIPFRVVVFVDDAERVIAQMTARGVEPRSVFYPMHKQPCFSRYEYSDDDFPASLECYRRGICLPTWIGLSDEQIQFVAESLLDSL